MLQYLVFIGAGVHLIGTSSYIYNTLRGKTKPNKVTWLLWAIAPLIGVFASLSDGVRLAVIPVFMAGFGPLLVFIVSFINSKAYWQLKPFDYLCGVCSLLALILWYISKDPIVAIIFAILADILAAIPTLAKAWHHPETEISFPFFTALFCQVTAFFAIKTWTPSSYLFPIYLVLMNILLILTIGGRKITKSTQ